MISDIPRRAVPVCAAFLLSLCFKGQYTDERKEIDTIPTHNLPFPGFACSRLPRASQVLGCPIQLSRGILRYVLHCGGVKGLSIITWFPTILPSYQVNRCRYPVLLEPYQTSAPLTPQTWTFSKWPGSIVALSLQLQCCLCAIRVLISKNCNYSHSALPRQLLNPT